MDLCWEKKPAVVHYHGLLSQVFFCGGYGCVNALYRMLPSLSLSLPRWEYLCMYIFYSSYSFFFCLSVGCHSLHLLISITFHILHNKREKTMDDKKDSIQLEERTMKITFPSYLQVSFPFLFHLFFSSLAVFIERIPFSTSRVVCEYVCELRRLCSHSWKKWEW